MQKVRPARRGDADATVRRRSVQQRIPHLLPDSALARGAEGRVVLPALRAEAAGPIQPLPTRGFSPSALPPHPHPDASPRASDLLPPTSRVLTFACASRLASVVQAAQGMSSRQQLRYLQLLAEEAAEPPVAPAAGADPRGYTTKYSASRGRTDAASAIAASSAPSSTSGKRPAVPPVQGVAKKSKAAVERGRKKAAEKKPGPSRTAVAPLARPGKSAKSAAAEGPAIPLPRPPRSLSAYALCRSCWRQPR